MVFEPTNLVDENYMSALLKLGEHLPSNFRGGNIPTNL